MCAVAAGCLVPEDEPPEPPNPCGGDPADEAVEQRSQAITSSNKLSVNRLSTNRLSVNRLSSNRLSCNGLDTTPIAGDELGLNIDPSNELINSEGGRELLQYVVRCAMPEGVTMRGVDEDGAVYEFAGSLGLGEQWATGPLTPTAQRWVSACLLAHVNAFGVPVPISVRGAHPNLTVDDAEQSEYLVQEAAFYGNLFQDEPVMLGCGGYGLMMADDLGLSSYLEKRVCASSESCGFVNVGPCYFSCEGDETCIEHKTLSEISAAITDRGRACDQRSSQGGYAACFDVPHTDGDESWHGRQGYLEVVTTYVPLEHAGNLSAYLDELQLSFEEFIELLEFF